MTSAWDKAGRPVALAVVLAAPSLFLVEARLGARALPIYVAYVGVVVALWRSGLGARLGVALGERRARVLAVLTLLALVALYVVIYPLANSGRFGRGSDGDEALNQATRALLGGHFPYYERTYLGNEITPMPGELVLAAPFVLLGNGAYQTFFWIVVGAFMLRACWRRDTAATLIFCWLVLAASPAVTYQIVTGSDYLANTLMVLAFSALLVAEGSPATGPLASGLAGVGLGLALSSRPNFFFFGPLVLSRLVQTRGWPRALGLGAVVALSATAVTLPFFIFDPAHFSPLHTRTKLSAFDGVLPHAVVVLPLLAAAVTLALCRPRWNGTTAAFLRNAAIVQGLLIFLTTALGLVAGHGGALYYTAFGQFFLAPALGVVALRHRAFARVG